MKHILQIFSTSFRYAENQASQRYQFYLFRNIFQFTQNKSFHNHDNIYPCRHRRLFYLGRDPPASPSIHSRRLLPYIHALELYFRVCYGYKEIFARRNLASSHLFDLNKMAHEAERFIPPRQKLDQLSVVKDYAVVPRLEYR